MALPDNYREVEYIAGVGEQYIDTGLTVEKSDSWRYVLVADLISSDNYAGANGYMQYQAKIGNGIKSTIDIVYKNITETISVDGVQISSQSWSSYNGTNVKLGILKLGDNGNSWYNGDAQSGKIYSCQIYKDSTLVRDFVPCYNPSNVAGLYDLVNDTFYPSASSTPFAGGAYITIKTGDILNFSYTGSVQTVNLPKGEYALEVWGAQGGYRSSSTYGGKGGKSYGILTLTKPTMVYIYVGGAGNTGKTSGGFNGGGKRGSYNGGGGASDIRIGTDSLYARVIVAGGGGSDGASSKSGMYGGGETGGSSTQNYGTGSYGGTQTGVSSSSWQTTSQSTSTTTQAGAYAGFGFGGNGITRSSGYGGAGGGGWYGGSGAYPDGSGDDDRGGGGGSGYVYTSTTAKNYPSGCLLNSSHYLANAVTKAGNTSFKGTGGSSETGHSGNGYARITVRKVQSLNMPVNIGGAWKDSDAIYVNIGGSWKEVENAYVNVGGTWKELT